MTLRRTNGILVTGVRVRYVERDYQPYCPRRFDCRSRSITIGNSGFAASSEESFMPKCVRRTSLVACAATLVGMLVSVPASAQSNLSGVWNNLGILNEDWPDRLPGPELGD